MTRLGCPTGTEVGIPPWEFSIHPCLLGRNLLHFLSLPQHSAHPFFTVSSRQVNISCERRGKKENKPPVSRPKRRKHCTFSANRPKPNRHRSPERRPEPGRDHKLGQVTSEGAPGSECRGPGRPTSPPALAAALAPPVVGGASPPAVGVWNAEAGTCRASSSQRLVQQQPQQRPAGHRSSPTAGWSREQASPGRAVLPAVPSGKEIKGLLTHQTRGLRSLNGLEESSR